MDNAPQGTLLVCPTPVGNLEDVTLRVLRALREADVIFAEDTRVSQALLRRYEIATPVRSYHESVESRRRRELVALLADGKTVALITDAGTPGISDPGVDLIRAARDAGASVEVLPGPTALVGAVVLSAFDCSRFRFEGFAPRAAGARRRAIAALAHETVPTIFYESPMRIRALLEDIAATLGDRPVFVLREYTKKFEEQLTGTAAHVLTKLDVQPKGEIAVVIDGSAHAAGAEPDVQRAEAAMRLLFDAGVPTRAAVDAIAAATGMKKNAAYDVAERLRREAP